MTEFIVRLQEERVRALGFLACSGQLVVRKPMKRCHVLKLHPWPCRIMHTGISKHGVSKHKGASLWAPVFAFFFFLEGVGGGGGGGGGWRFYHAKDSYIGGGGWGSMYRSTSFFGSRHLFLVLSSTGTRNNPPLIPIEPLAFQGAQL